MYIPNVTDSEKRGDLSSFFYLYYFTDGQTSVTALRCLAFYLRTKKKITPTDKADIPFLLMEVEVCWLFSVYTSVGHI